MKALDDRKLRILKYVVERYIETGEPTGSKLIAETFGNTVSSATIRNDMAALERVGLLEQPHTSAGRIPSHAGFRFYIANLMRREPISEADRIYIDETLLKGDFNPKTLISNATDLLAELTDCVVVSVSGEMSFSIITRVEVIPAGRRLYALLMITSSGAVENRVCRLEFDLTDEQIAFFVRFARENLTGMRLDELTDERLVELAMALSSYTFGLAPLLYGVYDISNELRRRRTEIKNETSLVAKRGFENQEIAQLLTRREALSGLLDRAFNGISVLFGDEENTFAISNSSFIVSPYGGGSRPKGRFGVLGPLRLDYSRIIPYIEYLTESVDRLIAAASEDERNKPTRT